MPPRRQPPPTVPYIAKGKINSGLPTTIDNAIPDWAKACTTGWKEESLKKRKFDVLTEEEYNDEHMGRAVADSFVHVAKSMASHLNNTGIDMNAANTVSHLISESVFADIRNYTSQQLVKRCLEPVSLYEFKRFYATKLLRSRFNLSTKKAWEAIMKSLAQTHGFTLMEYDRFNNILTSIRGYDVPSRSGDNGDETWLRQRNMLRKLNKLEKAIFERSMDILINTKSGALVVDDELVASCASDVEAKAFSDRKSGKDGAMADCLADSAICMLLGMTYVCYNICVCITNLITY